MTRTELTIAVEAAREETGAALQMMYDALNQGQQNKLFKNEAVKALLELYGVKV